MIKLEDLPALLNDLVTIRIFDPASKRRSHELMEQLYVISHGSKAYYRIAPYCTNLKRTVEKRLSALLASITLSISTFCFTM